MGSIEKALSPFCGSRKLRVEVLCCLPARRRKQKDVVAHFGVVRARAGEAFTGVLRDLE